MIKRFIHLCSHSAHAKLAALAVVLSYSVAHAQISFEESSLTAQIAGTGTTYGASWGDVNGDGWPDLWVGNHDAPPSLYVNQRDGTFHELASRYWSGDLHTDQHGAAWADFDRDGDQDLAVAVDAQYQADGSLVPAIGEDDLLLNEHTRLSSAGQQLGLVYTQETRTPLWIDANRDGQLDLLMVARASGNSSSRLYQQIDGAFSALAATESGLVEGRRRQRDLYLGFAENLLSGNFHFPTEAVVTPFQEFAQLADLNNDQELDLIMFANPIRVFDTASQPFKEITFALALPEINSVADSAIGDFDGDQDNDIALTLGNYIHSDLQQTGPQMFSANIYGYSNKLGLQGVDFVTQGGPVTFQLHPKWLDLNDVAIGTTAQHPETRTFVLDPEKDWVKGKLDDATADKLVITYEEETGIWKIRNGLQWQFVDLIVTSTTRLMRINPHNFKPFKPNGSHLILFNENDQLKRQVAINAQATTCMSIVTGDFDNDMDLDLYSACTSAIGNAPNLLFENDGTGRFTLVDNAGGASGSHLGRGDAVITADYDRDGFLDLFVANGADPTSPFVERGPHQLFRNRGNPNNWIEIDLIGTTSNVEAIGARVEVRTDNITQFREQTGNMHRFSQNYTRLHFGLGQYDRVDEITVFWPGGSVQRLMNSGVNQILEIVEDPQS